jgi:hypothetical protein
VFVKGSFKVIESSRDAEMVSSIKMQRYIRLDFVGFFFDWSSRIRMAVTYLWWKSSRIVKSSNRRFTSYYDLLTSLLVINFHVKMHTSCMNGIALTELGRYAC